jgi:hypothetical protein
MIHKKILFRLEREEDYPPFEVEGVWAEEQEDSGYELDNIPFFATQATLGDVVEVMQVGDELFYASTRERSTNSLLRVVFFDGHDWTQLRSDLSKLGCSSELFGISSLIAINVPSTVEIDEVRALLDEGCRKGFWDYEEAILRQ